jgi:hypothetical protein
MIATEACRLAAGFCFSRPKWARGARGGPAAGRVGWPILGQGSQLLNGGVGRQTFKQKPPLGLDKTLVFWYNTYVEDDRSTVAIE